MSSKDRYPYPGKLHPGDIYEVFRKRDEPVLSTTEINREIDFAHKSTVRRKLIEMESSGKIRSKKAGDRENAGMVWYPPEELPEIPQPTPDIVKLIYRYPWLSLIVGGILSIGIGFLFYIPGTMNQGLYLGLIEREWLVRVSFVMTVIGVLASYTGSIVFIVKAAGTAVRNWM